MEQSTGLSIRNLAAFEKELLINQVTHVGTQELYQRWGMEGVLDVRIYKHRFLVEQHWGCVTTLNPHKTPKITVPCVGVLLAPLSSSYRLARPSKLI